VVLVADGYRVMADAKYRGGDSGSLSVLTSLIFDIVLPGIIGLLVIADTLLVLRLRRELRR
jgi:hypothetical protein